MGISCKNCGGSEIDFDHARGDAVCVGCGSVVQDHCIVNEVEFAENSAGGASVIGTFVSNEGSHGFSVGPGGKYGLGKDHRQAILDNGRRMIQSIGSQLKLSGHCIDAAFMFYKLAVSKRLTPGRRTIHTIGACIYLVTRTEQTSHMLLDVCDAIQVDVVTLGRVFLSLARELCIDCPVVDPSLYIHRFAHQLDFGEHENEVAMTALRIMARMKKDWIHLGRRPSSLCGAALIIGAKLHGFDLEMKSIVKLVRMSKATVFKRLQEFGKTATSKLTTDEFKKVNLEEEADPPCYTAGRNRAKFAQECGEKYTFVSTDVLAQVATTQKQLDILLDKRKSINSDLKEAQSEAVDFQYKSRLPTDYSTYASAYDVYLESQESVGGDCSADLGEPAVDAASSVADAASNSASRSRTMASQTLLLDDAIRIAKERNRALREKEERAAKDDAKGLKVEVGGSSELHNELDLDGIDDDEIDNLLLTEDEIKVKTELFMKENREYLQKMKEKEEAEKRQQETENKDGVKKKNRTNKRKSHVDKPSASTADEAIKTMLAERKLSSKINYDVLRGLKAEGDSVNLMKSERLDVGVDHTSLIDGMIVAREVLGTGDMPIVYESGPTVNKRAAKRPGQVLPAQIGIPSKAMKVEDVAPSKIQKPSLQTFEEKPALACVTGSAQVVEKRVIVESGPVVGDRGGENFIDDEEEDFEAEGEEDVTAAKLFGRNVDEYEDYEHYDDDGFY